MTRAWPRSSDSGFTPASASPRRPRPWACPSAPSNETGRWPGRGFIGNLEDGRKSEGSAGGADPRGDSPTEAGTPRRDCSERDMDGQRWQEVKRVFGEAMDRPAT